MSYNPLRDEDLKRLQSMIDPERISTGESNRALHSKDQSGHTARLPDVVIWPINSEEVSEIIRYANAGRIPIIAWGAGSSVEGNPIPVMGGIVLDFSEMNRILDIRDEDFQADVEPGVIYQDLNDKLRHRGLFFPPDPGARATIGGMIGNNASGTRTLRYGSTRKNILRLSIVLASGEIIKTGTRSSKSSSGYDLINLFVGSEGTLGVVTEATVRLVGLPVEFSTAIIPFPSIEAAGRAVYEIIKSGLDPAMLELLGPECVELMNKEMDLGAIISPTLFIEFHGPSKEYLAELLEITEKICESEGSMEIMRGVDRDERENLLKARHGMAEMMMRAHPDTSHRVIDVAVPISAYPGIIAAARDERTRVGIPAYILSHAGDGNLHITFQLKKDDEKEHALFEGVNQRIVSKALSLGGTATGEHGVGIGKRKFMEAEHGASLEFMKKIKKTLDPAGILNPGKMFL